MDDSAAADVCEDGAAAADEVGSATGVDEVGSAAGALNGQNRPEEESVVADGAAVVEDSMEGMCRGEG